MNDFRQQLAATETAEVEETWYQFWQRAFPDTIRQEVVRGKCDLQYAGVDRILHLPLGKQIWVEEKTRTVDWGDFLVEEFSNYERRTPGWTVDCTKLTEYVGYAVEPAGKCYLLPYQLLRQACIRNLPEWKTKYSSKYARNRNYRTLNWSIPWSEIHLAILKEQLSPMRGLPWTCPSLN